MHSKLLFISVLAVLLSCGEKKDEVLDISEILPTSSRDYSGNQEKPLENAQDSANFYKQQFLGHGILLDGLVKLEGSSFPERFNPTSTDRFDLIFNNDTVRYQRWIYQDSAKVKSAFFNWMDCFGEECKSIVVGEEKSLNREALHLLVNDSAIILISGDNDFDKWYRFHHSLGLGNNWKYVIEQKRSGKTNWFKYIEGERIPINPPKTNCTINIYYIFARKPLK